MKIELIIAVVSLFFTIIFNLASLAFFAGVLSSNQKHQKETLEDLKVDFKEHFKRLEYKQDKHNCLIERMVHVEDSTKSAHKRIDGIVGVNKC